MGIRGWRLQPFQGCTLLVGLYPRVGAALPGVSDGETLPGSWRLVTSLCSLPLDETLPGSFGLCRPWRGLNVCNPWVGAYADEASRPPWGIRDNTGRQPRRWLQTIAWRLQPFQGYSRDTPPGYWGWYGWKQPALRVVLSFLRLWAPRRRCAPTWGFA